MSQKSTIETVDQIINHAKDRGIIHLATEDSKLENNIITVNQQKLVNFGSCSYLGLEFNESLRNGAKDAIDAYGTQFSSSRAYMSPAFYVELEDKLSQIFGSPTIVTATTTLGHQAALPVLINQNDAVILDHQVHSSVQTAANQLKAKKIHVELVRHNRMDLLEKRILELKGQYDKIWYMADGIYSMFGDTVPIDEVYRLLDKYPEFNFYVDDAHAMSCFGENGRGFVLNGRKIHDRMIVATSFAKAFATGGGALIFPNKEVAQRVRNCGGSLITSGPMQPSALGAAIASANIHLSDQITELQEDLQENIRYTNLALKRHGLPNLSEETSPIFFIAVGLPKIGYNLIEKMMKDGHYLNLGIFPAVPIKNTGVRFTITRLHTFEQIEQMVESMAKHFPLVIEEADYSIEQIYKAFRIEQKFTKPVTEKKLDSLNLTIFKSIAEINHTEWNNLLGARGAFDAEYLQILENSFKSNKEKQDNWEFDYIVVRDNSGEIVLATFTTLAILKDDMLMPNYISTEVERRRVADPFYLTSKTLTVGSPMTEGDHLYLNKKNDDWKKAIIMLMNKLEELQNRYDASNIIIRDLNSDDREMDGLMMDNSFFKIGMPDSAFVEEGNWAGEEEFYNSLSTRSKRHFRENIRRFEDDFNISIVNTPTELEIFNYYQLYLNVKQNSLDLNTFELPFKFFKQMVTSENWEFIVLSLKNSDKNEPVGVVFAYKTENLYNGLIVGIDYDKNYEYNVYRQAMYQVIKRGKELKNGIVPLGFSAIIEKKKFGAKIKGSCAYVQAKDNYNMEALNTISTQKDKKLINYGTNDRGVLPV
ncbi:MAG: aminotransferase class I/II-fold pyridoxal phosphate-dependent enzyme [Crocinitomix sp.]|nr:aminotransferase class I/II-fold pyridoxal phosphate-dependent enzyme [Crocinitomix sp.]